MTILVLYAYPEVNSNAKFFVDHGLVQWTGVDYLFLGQGLTLPDWVKQQPYKESKYLSWLSGLDQDYDYYILLSSECRGPFLTKWTKTPWYRGLTKLLDDQVRLAGPVIRYDGQPYVDDYCLVTDRVGLKLIKPALAQGDGRLASKLILEAGYNLACLQLAYRGLDYKEQVPDTKFYDQGIHPIEVMFIVPKTDFEHQAMSVYSSLIDIDWREYLYLNRDVARATIPNPEFAIRHWIEYGRAEGRQYKTDRPFDQIFNPSRYLDKYPDLRINGFHTEHQALIHFLFWGVDEGRTSD